MFKRLFKWLFYRTVTVQMYYTDRHGLCPVRAHVDKPRWRNVDAHLIALILTARYYAGDCDDFKVLNDGSLSKGLLSLLDISEVDVISESEV